jgi:type II secretory pathway predicted ATPase ExeA
VVEGGEALLAISQEQTRSFAGDRVDPWCQMLETFHQLREPPFGVNPDPRFLYLSRTHREAFSSLLYRLELDSGFLAMVAQPGMGKTTLLFHLLERLRPKARTAFIFQTQCSSSELLRHLLSEFECRADTTDPVRVLQELKSMLVAEASVGRRCVLIVDEAQNLGPEVLETIRLLSNFETPRRKLLNIVLSGQGELGEMLARAELRQLRQRLSCIVRLERFTPGETAHYIAHRLAVAGYSGQLSGLFTADAVARIADVSEGVPRIINNLCFNTLSLSYALGARQIDLDLVEEAALDLGLSGEQNAEPDQPTVEVRKDAFAMLEISAVLAESPNDPTASPEAADPIIVKNIEEQPREIRGPEKSYMPAAPAPERRVVAAPFETNSNRAPRRQKEAVLARGLACLLILLLTPAIDWPANPSVSAKSLEIPSSAKAALASSHVTIRHPRSLPHSNTKYARVSHRRYSQWVKHSSRDARVPVDLALASFVPEPLLEPKALEPMPLTTGAADVASAPGTRAPARTPGDAEGTRPAGRVSDYVPPRPVWQPAPSVPAWYRHPKEDIQLLLSISSRGEVSGVGILSGHGTLAYAAKRAAERWRYQPAIANGEAVNSKVIVTIQFLQH